MNRASRSLRILVCLCLSVGSAAFAQGAAAQMASLNNAMTACAEHRYEEARSAMAALLEDAGLAARDPLRAAATEVLAEASQGLGDSEAAARLYLAVLSAADENSGAGLRLISAASIRLGDLRGGQGRWEEATALIEKSLAVRRRLYGDHHPLTAVGLEASGTLRLAMGDFEKAGVLLEQAVGILRTAGQPYRSELVSALDGLGLVYNQSAQFSAATPILEEAVATAAQLGEHDLAFADAQAELANLFLARGMTDRADPLLRKAVAIYEAAGALNGQRGACVLTRLGQLRLNEEKYLEAERYFRQALEILRKVYGPNHPCVGIGEMNLALACVHVAKTQESDQLLRHSYEIESAVSPESRALAFWYSTRAQLESKLKHGAQADACFRQAIAMLEKTAGPGHPLTAEALMAYAAFLRPDRKKEAASLLRRAVTILSVLKKD